MTFYMVKGFPGFVDRLLKKKSNRESLGARSNSSKKNRLFLIFALTILIQLLVVELIQRKSVFKTIIWIGDHFSAFIINYFLIAVVCLFFVSIIGSLRWGVISSTILLVLLSLTNMVKEQFLGEPLFPWDLPRADQALNLLPKVAGEIVVALSLLGVLTLIVILATRLFVPRYKLRASTRIIALAISVLALTGMVLYRHTPLKIVYEKMDIQHVFWVQSENSLINGFLLGFVMNTEAGIIREPEDYSENEIRKIFQEYDLASRSSDENDKNQIKPDIIIMMNESFWDPTVLPGINFSEDPLPFFRELRRNNISGIMISPEYGGSTANVEFEFLTGLSTVFLPTGSIPYQQYVQKSVPSLVKVFKNNGYRTTAIHPYHDWFYEREEVYPKLGFDSFLHLDYFQENQVRGEYIGDYSVSRKIIEQIERADQPQLLFALTMQNHGPYPAERYERTSIDVTGKISDEGKELLEVYAEGLKDADDSLGFLVNYLKKADRPTVLVFTGDHLPYLGKDYLVYKETGFIEGSENRWTVEEILKMKSIPFVVWTNYQNELLSTKDFISPISTSFLGGQLLDIININSNDYHPFTFTRHFSRDLPVFDKTVSMDNTGKTYRQLPEHLQQMQKDYRLLQYDILFGEEYYRKYLTQ